MNAARKAVRTKAARKTLQAVYGETTRMVLMDLVQGRDDNDVMGWNGLTRQSLAAYKANLTRGTYGKLLRDCNF